MQIGDVIYLHPSTSTGGKVYPGKVVYIHPKRRFYVAEFSFTRMDGVVQSFRESFFFQDRAGDPNYRGQVSDEERKRRDRVAHYNKKKGK